jgi:hypothetical protein
MTDYNKATNFATKDALVTGDPLKVVKGTEIDDEFNAIEDSIETKADLASPTFTGVPKAPTAAAGTNTTQLATTAFVKGELDVTVFNTDNLADGSVTTAKLADGSVTTAKLANNAVTSAKIEENAVTTRELNVADSGTEGQVLVSDGDGSFSWDNISLANLDVSAIGMVAFLCAYGSPPAIAYGEVIDTSAISYTLRPACVYANVGLNNNGSVIQLDTGTTITGSWMCLGYLPAASGGSINTASLFVRVA